MVVLMAVNTVRRLAAELLNVGKNRIRISSENISEVKSAMTRADVKALIDKGAIKALPKKGRKKKAKRKKRGSGSIKGSEGKKRKREWMTKIRAQRKIIGKLVELGALSKEDKREIYMKAKSGLFRNKKAMLNYLKENEFIPEEFELPKEERVARKKPEKPKPGKEEKPKEEKKEGEKK
jgi:large subunit ribosomal protein L19e